MPSLLLKRIKDWATSITAFRTGDVIPVDGPSGTAKMSKDDLLKVTAQNALAGNVAQEFDPTLYPNATALDIQNISVSSMVDYLIGYVLQNKKYLLIDKD